MRFPCGLQRAQPGGSLMKMILQETNNRISNHLCKQAFLKRNTIKEMCGAPTSIRHQKRGEGKHLEHLASDTVQVQLRPYP